MTNSKSNAAAGTDWTGLLADPDLARNLGKLLQIYRDAPPDRREQALLAAMREIKQASNATLTSTKVAETSQPPLPTQTSAIPPFEPDIFSSNWADKIGGGIPESSASWQSKLRVNDAMLPSGAIFPTPALGGCQVETAAHISGGAKVEIGLWVASGKIWVKGLALNGVVTRSAPAAGVRVRFAGMEAAAKENLRQFLRYVQETTELQAAKAAICNC
jgi:hypothetical protein